MRSVTRVTDIMGEIASASDEQSRGIEQVTQAVTQMDQVTQQNAAPVVESASAAAALEEQAITLADAVAVFRLADDNFVAPETLIHGKGDPGLSNRINRSYFCR